MKPKKLKPIPKQDPDWRTNREEAEGDRETIEQALRKVERAPAAPPDRGGEGVEIVSDVEGAERHIKWPAA
jgi:hypothetical protein